MGPSPILFAIHSISIGIMLNFNGGNNGHGLKRFRVNRPLVLRRKTNSYSFLSFFAAT